MEDLFNITYWQYFLVGVMVAGGVWASAKNKTIFAKLVFMVLLTLVVGLQLLRAPAPKETALDSRIRLERQLLGSYIGRPEVPAQLESLLAELDKLNASETERNNAAKAEPLLKQLEELKLPTPAWQEQLKTLVASWRDRMASTPAELKKQLAALEDKASKTPEDEAQISRLKGMIPSWHDKLPLKLGLDLRGGTEVRLRLLPDRERLDNFQRQLRTLQAKKSESKEDLAAIKDLEEKIKKEEDLLKDNFSNASDVIRSRVNPSGLEEISVTTQGGDKLLIQMPGMSSAEAQNVIERVKKLGQLEFRLTVPTQGKDADPELVAAMAKLGGDTDHRNFSKREGRFLGDDEVIIRDGRKTDAHGDDLYDWLHGDSGQGEAVEQNIRMTGDFLTGARENPSTENPGGYDIAFWLSPRGSFIFGQLTGNNIGRQLAIVLDGKLKSAPRINGAITNNGSITGSFTKQEAKDLAIVLKSGSLKTRVEVDFENTVGPTLGEDSIRAGITAMLIGSGLVLLFMLVYYHVAGLITDLVMVTNLLLIMALLSASNATLTLPGIAGLVLTVGMAVDANVLVFERIREEREKGNTLARAIQLGYERAFVTIIDANVTTFIIALILHQFGTEAVKGFAITLIIGIICSVFTSLVFTRWCFDALLSWGWIRELTMFKFFSKPNIPFTKLRRPAMVLSLICIAAGLAVFVARGNKNLSQDFTGGLFVQAALAEGMSVADARERVKPLEKFFPDLSLQSYGQETGGKFREFILRTADVLSPEQVAAIAAAAKDGNKADLPKTRATKTAQDLRQMIEQAFPLQKNGLNVSQTRIKDKSTEQKAAFRVDISTETPHLPAEVAEMLKRNTILENVTALGEAATAQTAVSLEVSLPIMGADGKQRDDSELSSIVRDQVQKLRYQGMLNFTEPFPRFSSIGATVANEMISSAVMALIFSWAAIFVYIWLRFKFKASFGAGAVVALIHDVLFTMGALAVADEFNLLNGQISLTVVAALLTLVGYSINDTIVVFDRIRENMHLAGKTFAEQIDIALNQTLSRTIITSLTVWIVVIVLLIFGGEVIRGFAFALVVGVVVGTYSSVFIAAPILLEFTTWGQKRAAAKARQKLAQMQSAEAGSNKSGAQAGSETE